MPVSGIKHPRVWQFGFRPIPCPVLDRAWDYDWQWERGVVEKLLRGKSAPRALSLAELLETDSSYGNQASGWARTEEWAKDADRTNSIFLKDEDIARRLSEREAREKAYKEFLAEEEIRAEKARKRAEEKRRERTRVEAEEREKMQRRREEKARREQEWRDWRDSFPNEREAILRTQWQCKCSQIANIVWDPGKELFVVWCPFCLSTRHIPHQKLADRLRGRI